MPKTSALAIALVLLLAPAASAATPRKGAGYMGRTSQGETIAFDVSTNGKLIVGLETALTYTCTAEHDGQSGYFTLDEVKLRAKGSFASRQTLRGISAESVVQGGVGTVKGSFKRKGKRATGAIRSKLTLSSGETCDSGKVKFEVSLL
jgi:hypothetical protein